MAQGAGSAGNVIAALCSFLYPGLGQLLQRNGYHVQWIRNQSLSLIS